MNWGPFLRELLAIASMFVLALMVVFGHDRPVDVATVAAVGILVTGVLNGRSR